MIGPPLFNIFTLETLNFWINNIISNNVLIYCIHQEIIAVIQILMNPTDWNPIVSDGFDGCQITPGAVWHALTLYNNYYFLYVLFFTVVIVIVIFVVIVLAEVIVVVIPIITIIITIVTRSHHSAQFRI